MTAMAGVIIPSPISNAVPAIAMIKKNLSDLLLFLFNKAKAANIPPSPLLSACNTITIYLRDITRIRDQKIRDKIPSILELIIETQLRGSRKAKKRLVHLAT